MAERSQKERFFDLAREQFLVLTYDDVRLKTDYSEVMPHEVDLSSRFTKRVPLITPFASAAMDTVTEYALAIEMAKLGGNNVRCLHSTF